MINFNSNKSRQCPLEQRYLKENSLYIFPGLLLFIHCQYFLNILVFKAFITVYIYLYTILNWLINQFP